MRFPNDISEEKSIEQMIRVNHAGEYGAKRIYQGQLAVLKGKKSEAIIRKMAEQEEEHLRDFSQMVSTRKIRPTALLPVWHFAGYALGAASALLGEKAAMACTVAVEEVIDEHYQSQIQKLNKNKKEKKLNQKIKKFREDELEHRDIGIAHDAESAPAYSILTSAVKAASKTAIWLSKRI